MERFALVIEPDDVTRSLVRDVLSDEGFIVVEARSAEEALCVAGAHRWALLFSVDRFGTTEGAGQEFVGTLRGRLISTPHIVLVGHQGGAKSAFEAVLQGAADYFRKPFRAKEIRAVARKVMQRLQASADANGSSFNIDPRTLGLQGCDLGLVGESEPIVEELKSLARSLGSEMDSNPKLDAEIGMKTRPPSYFITGETGTGKELVARIIHRYSRYRGGPFVAINCGALPADLAESELFGYMPGAFTGAVKEKKGLWEVADGGTLFLDEITEAPPNLQPKLLRALQEGAVIRLGASWWQPVNVQIVASSNREVEKEVEAGRFREDLYHRLSLHRVHLPPLRARREDIPLLVAHFARRYAAGHVRFSQDAMELLLSCEWPGNVRQLENVIRSAVAQSSDGHIFASDILARLNGAGKVRRFQLSGDDSWREHAEGESDSKMPLEAEMRKLKLRAVKEALKRNGGNVTRTAAALGVTRPTLYKLLKEVDTDNS